MVDRPIIFSGPMVRALLDGRKTQTRRVLKPQPSVGCDGERPIVTKFGELAEWRDGERGHRGYFAATCKPWFHPHDRLWVREVWSGEYWLRDIPPSDRLLVSHPERLVSFPPETWYWSNGSPEYGDWERPRPSIHMPRWASRLTLIVTDVRVQRLQDIEPDDAYDEGVKCDMSARTVVEHYRNLWNSINAKRGYPWESNPWVCALTFDVIQKNIDALPTSAAGM